MHRSAGRLGLTRRLHETGPQVEFTVQHGDGASVPVKYDGGRHCDANPFETMVREIEPVTSDVACDRFGPLHPFSSV